MSIIPAWGGYHAQIDVIRVSVEEAPSPSILDTMRHNGGFGRTHGLHLFGLQPSPPPLGTIPHLPPSWIDASMVCWSSPGFAIHWSRFTCKTIKLSIVSSGVITAAALHHHHSSTSVCYIGNFLISWAPLADYEEIKESTPPWLFNIWLEVQLKQIQEHMSEMMMPNWQG